MHRADFGKIAVSFGGAWAEDNAIHTRLTQVSHGGSLWLSNDNVGADDVPGVSGKWALSARGLTPEETSASRAALVMAEAAAQEAGTASAIASGVRAVADAANAKAVAAQNQAAQFAERGYIGHAKTVTHPDQALLTGNYYFSGAGVAGLPDGTWLIDVIGADSEVAIQRFYAYYGNAFYPVFERRKFGTWGQFTPAAFPYPKQYTDSANNTLVGSWTTIVTPPGGTFVLPPGGTWAFLWMEFVNNNGENRGVYAGVKPGGSAIRTAAAGNSINGLQWRIA